MTAPQIMDDDKGVITAETPLKIVRSWNYSNRDEQMRGMLLAREFAEGWFQAERAHRVPERDLSEFTGEVDPKQEKRAADRLGNALAPIFK